MPRDGSGVSSPPPGTGGAPDTTILSAMFNAWVADVTATFNSAWPVALGGTGTTDLAFPDGTIRFKNTTDPTAKLAFDLSGITTATTRTFKAPDKDGTLALVELRVCFRADKNGVDQTAIGNGAVTFTHEVFDVGSHYDATNSRWTPPAGKVRLHARVLLAGPVTDQIPYVLSFTKNGTVAFSSVIRASGTASQSMDISEIVETNGTDYWGVNLNSGGASITASGPIEYTTFSGEML